MTTRRNAVTTPVASVSGQCPNCGETVEIGGCGRGRVFCRPRCRELFANRNKVEGGTLLPLVLASIETRHAKPGTREAEICRLARAEIVAISREFIARRKEKGMPPAADYVETLFRDGERYMDRARG